MKLQFKTTKKPQIMILIADSGSTKTHWCIADNSSAIKHIYTKGINPFYQTEEEIQQEIQLNLIPELAGYSINQIYFYGAGCSFPEKKKLVSNALEHYFKDTMIEVQSDLLAAARSLFGEEKGIACILGTGSNSCYYNGSEITENVSPLGFILGDEGSGAVLGKTLVADVLKNQLAPELKTKFLTQYNISPAEILENVYKKPFPNRFLASFSKFLHENIENASIYQIVYNSFSAFVKRNLLQYDFENVHVRCIGSVGYYFKNILADAAKEYNIQIDKIEQSPMEGLLEYHFNKATEI